MPKQKLERVQPRIPADLASRVRAIAKSTHRTFQGCVAWLLEDAVYAYEQSFKEKDE